jgi:uncharacterized protein YoxC
MDILIDIVLPAVFIVVGIALIWFVIELVVTLRRTRAQVGQTLDTLNPTLENVKQLTDELKPVVQNVDPLVQRVTLTVDAANLEIMRLDEILEDVSQITDAAQKATAAVEGITSAPMDVVTGVTKKVRAKIKPSYASKESRELGDKKVAEGSEGTTQSGAQNPVAQLADAAIDAASEVIAEQRERRSEEKQNQAAAEERAATQEAELNQAAGVVVEQTLDNVNKDTAQAN